MKFETAHFQVLVALSESESLSQAAQKLNVTQSAVSQTLRSLEQKLDLVLLTRTGKQMHLTASGKRLARIAQVYTRKLEQTIDKLHEDQYELKGELKVATMPGLGKSWISYALIDFLREHQELQLHLTLDFAETILEKFEKGQLDVLILPEPMLPVWCEKTILRDEYSTLVYPESWDERIQETQSLQDLLQLPLLMFEDHDPLFYDWCRANFQATPKQVTPKLVVNAFGQIMHSIDACMGIAVIPTHVFERSRGNYKIKAWEAKKVKIAPLAFGVRNEDSSLKKIQMLKQLLKREMVK
jgi:DNA-binding transcriptional LysR family regulator